MERHLGLAVETLRELVEDVGNPVHPATLLARLGPDVAQRLPEAECPVAHGQDRSAHPTVLEAAEHVGPALRALPVAVLDRDQLLRPVRPHADHHQRAQAVLFQADAEVHAIGPDVDVVAVGEIARLERLVVRLPRGGQARDCGRREARCIVTEERGQALLEITGG